MKRVKIGFEAPEQLVERVDALAARELLSRADIWRTAAKQYVEARETRAVSHAMKVRPRVGPYPTYG
jgi:metal-responsive CopG/Arc/MetJ family transcriptional regulator